jgi:UDP-GlcNAc:undecaprenyl-phosphate/decaprenyl-phosphate GlcNAc-1-phosphate transferase
MFDVILSLIISFAVTYLAIPVIIKVAESKKLYDEPDERKVHRNPIPSLGGLGIFAGFVFGALLSISLVNAPEIQYFIAAALVIFFLGIKDDILVLSPIKKFIGQVLAAFIIVYKGNVQITSMHGFIGLQELPEMFSLLLTYFTVLVIINSFNLIDGVDGLAGCLGILSTSVMGIYMLQVGEIGYSILAFSLTGSLMGFIIFNFQPAKIFMGDTGSLLIGLVNAILVIKFINIASLSTVSMPLAATPAIGFAILLIPLLDTLRVFAIRMWQRRSPFSPDRNHIHHLLLDKGLSHRQIVFTLVSANLILIVFAFTVRSIGCNWLILLLVSIFFSGIAALYYTSNRSPRLFVAKRIAGNGKQTTSKTKIVPLTEDAVLEQK